MDQDVMAPAGRDQVVDEVIESDKADRSTHQKSAMDAPVKPEVAARISLLTPLASYQGAREGVRDDTYRPDLPAQSELSAGSFFQELIQAHHIEPSVAYYRSPESELSSNAAYVNHSGVNQSSVNHASDRHSSAFNIQPDATSAILKDELNEHVVGPYCRLSTGPNTGGLPVRYVFRHCPAVLNFADIQRAWRDTLLDEVSLWQQLTLPLYERVLNVLTLQADGWPLYFSDHADMSLQTMSKLTVLLRWSSDDLVRCNQASLERGFKEPENESDYVSMEALLPYRLVLLTGSNGFSGVLLIARQCLYDSQTLQYILVRLWRRYSGQPPLLPMWQSRSPAPTEYGRALAFWCDKLVEARFSLLPRDVSSRQGTVPQAQTVPSAQAILHAPTYLTSGPHTPATKTNSPYSMAVRFMPEDQRRLILQVAAVLSVSEEVLMLSAFVRWQMQVNHESSACLGVLAVREPTAPVSPPELCPFIMASDESLTAAQWVTAVAKQLAEVRKYPLPHLKDLSNAMNQSSDCIAQMLLETVFCFESVDVEWPEMLAPITSIGNANGLMGTHAVLQLSIDITEERMRVTWWGKSSLISQTQLCAFQKNYEQTLQDLLHGVLRFNQWSCLSPRKKLPLTCFNELKHVASPFGRLYGDFTNMNHVLARFKTLVELAPHALCVATPSDRVTRLEVWLSALHIAQAHLYQHPQFERAETHHPLMLITSDPVSLFTLMLAAQLCQLVPLTLSDDAQNALSVGNAGNVWSACTGDWLVVTRESTPHLATEHDHLSECTLTVKSIDVRRVLSRVRRYHILCAENGLYLDRWQAHAWYESSFGSAAHLPESVSLWLTRIVAFYTAQGLAAISSGQAEEPVYGYLEFSDTASALDSQLLSSSEYWLAQARHFEQVAAQHDSVLGHVVCVGNILDYTGMWPFYSAILSGAPVMWLPPSLLFITSAMDQFGLPESLAEFLLLKRALNPTYAKNQRNASPTNGVKRLSPQAALSRDNAVQKTAVQKTAVQTIASHVDASRNTSPINKSPINKTGNASRVNTSLCFMPELCFAHLLADASLCAVASNLQKWSRVILMGEGRLVVPEHFPSPTFLLSVCERKASFTAEQGIGENDVYEGRVPFGFVHRVFQGEERVPCDTLELDTLLPRVAAFASGVQWGTLAYCRSALRVNIQGMWSHPLEHRALASHEETDELPLSGSLRREDVAHQLRWELTVQVILRDRENPLIEPEDARFRPRGAWEAPCRFWERFVQRHLPVNCWVKVRPENAAEGICSIRLVPQYVSGVSSDFLDHLNQFMVLAPWARFYRLNDSAWVNDMAPRWNEILGRNPILSRVSTSMENMSFTRLVAYVLGLRRVPRVTQTWVELGGDWFAVCRLTSLLHRLGWSWWMPIHVLRQPLGRMALQLKPHSLSQPLRTEHGSRTVNGAVSITHTEVSLPLSGYQMGLIRRYQEGLPQQVRRLHFCTNATLSKEAVCTVLASWMVRFPVLASYFEWDDTVENVENVENEVTLGQQVCLPTTPERCAVLCERALEFYENPFPRVSFEKDTLENITRDLTLSSAPLWRCLVYTKPRGHWVVWIFAHRLLFDMREWLESVCALQQLMSAVAERVEGQRDFAALPPEPDVNRPHSGLERTTHTDPVRTTRNAALSNAALEQCVCFWQERLKWRGSQFMTESLSGHAGNVIRRTEAKASSQSVFKIRKQTLPWKIDGPLWRLALANGNTDNLALLLWAVAKTFSEWRGQAPLRFDLEVPWISVNRMNEDGGYEQYGRVPFFLSVHNWTQNNGDLSVGLTSLKQQLYATLLAPHPENLLMSGVARHEQLYEALCQQEVCFSFIDSCLEHKDILPLSELEHTHRFLSNEFLHAKSAYTLSIEAYSYRGHFVLAWTYNETRLNSALVNHFAEQVLSLLSRALGALASARELGKQAHHDYLNRSALLHRNDPVCPVDFGLEDISRSDWARLVADFPEVQDVWEPQGLNAWIFENHIKNPLTLLRGSQAIRCALPAVSVFRKRVRMLSVWVPHLAARWVILSEGRVLLVVSAGYEVCVREAMDRPMWDKPVDPSTCLDEHGLPIPCVFMYLPLSEGYGLVRCDYDVRALEPNLVSAVLMALAEGTMGPIKNAMSIIWAERPKGSGLRVNTEQSPLVASFYRDAPSYTQACQAYWKAQFQRYVGDVSASSWLPITEPVDFDRDSPIQLLRHTTLSTAFGDTQAMTVEDRGSFIRVLQTIRRYLLRLWGDRRWVVNVVFADRHALVQSGMNEVWAETVATTQLGWIPVLLGTGQESTNDTLWLDEQLRASAQFLPHSEAQLLEWLGEEPYRHLTDIVLLVASGKKGMAALEDWHRIQLSPFQFQWNPAYPSDIRLSAHAGLTLMPTYGVHLPNDQVIAQAQYFPGIKRAILFELAAETLVRDVGSVHNEAIWRKTSGETDNPYSLRVLNVLLNELPASIENFTVALFNYLSKRLVSEILPDAIRVCREEDWGIVSCAEWLQDAHPLFQDFVARRLTSVWWRPEYVLWSYNQSSTWGSDRQYWFQAVNQTLPGWRVAQRKASLMSSVASSEESTLSARAVRNLFQWAQWFGWNSGTVEYAVNVTDGRWELTPDQASWLALDMRYPNHFNTNLLLEFKKSTATALEQAARTLVLSDPIFRLYFVATYDEASDNSLMSDRLQQCFSRCSNDQLVDGVIQRLDFSTRNFEQTLESISSVAAVWQERFDLLKAPLIRFLIFDTGNENTNFVLILGHRFVVDNSGVQQLALRLDALLNGRAMAAVRTWSHWLGFLAQQRTHVRQLPPVSHDYEATVRQVENQLTEKLSTALEVAPHQLRMTLIQNCAVRRQFLRPLSEEQATLFGRRNSGLQDPRTVLCLSTLALAVAAWVGVDEVVIGQQWPVRQDPRIRHWNDVVGSFEFVFKNHLPLVKDSPLLTASHLMNRIPIALQNAISDALVRDQYDAIDAFNLIVFDCTDHQNRELRSSRLQPLALPLGQKEHGENRRRSLIVLEATFGVGQLELRWIYDHELLRASYFEGLISYFAYYWEKLRDELGLRSENQRAEMAQSLPEEDAVDALLL